MSRSGIADISYQAVDIKEVNKSLEEEFAAALALRSTPGIFDRPRGSADQGWPGSRPGDAGWSGARPGGGNGCFNCGQEGHNVSGKPGAC